MGTKHSVAAATSWRQRTQCSRKGAFDGAAASSGDLSTLGSLLRAQPSLVSAPLNALGAPSDEPPAGGSSAARTRRYVRSAGRQHTPA